MNEYNSIIQEESSLYFTDAKTVEQTISSMETRINKAIDNERKEKSSK